MKVSELTGAKLDYWVAQAEGLDVRYCSDRSYVIVATYQWSPSTRWSEGGPIFEREGFGICKFYEPTDGPIPEGGEWCALWRDDSMRADGPTPLIAGMRLFVMSKYGEEVPEE
jgi:hypothetical protein